MENRVKEKYSELDNALTEYTLFPKLNVLNICLIGVFSALCYVTLIFKIPLPTVTGSNASVHLGNCLVMLLSVIFDGVTGGLSGSIGMGLYDILNGYASSSVKTIVLKLGIGLITGLVFYILNKKDKKVFIPLLLSSIFFFAIGTICLTLSLTNENGLLFVETTGKNVNMFWATYSFSYIIAIVSVISLLISPKIKKQLQFVLVACICGFMFNLLGEFIYAFIKQLILGYHFNASIIFALAKMPATIINGTMSVVIVVLVYAPLRMAIPQTRSHGLKKH